MASNEPSDSPVRSNTTLEANEEARQPVKQSSRWRVICQPKRRVLIGWTVVAVLLVSSVLLYFITETWSELDYEDKPDIRKKRQVVVLMISGMRWDLLDTLTERDIIRGFLPFYREGVQVAHVKPVFPSYPMPSWTTLQTGLYPESHGILGGAMYDKKARKVFDELNASVKDARWWQESEPIWITATKQGKRVATLEWNNADVPFSGLLPEVASGYTASSEDFVKRMVMVTQLLKEEFNLVMMAYDGVDNATLLGGTFSDQVRQELRQVAKGLHLLFSFVFREGLQQRVQVLLVSDRGFESVCHLRQPPPLTPTLEDLGVEPEHVTRAVVDRHLLLVYAPPGNVSQVLRRLQVQRDYVTVLRKDIPPEFQYKGGKWAPDILMYPLAWNRTGCERKRGTSGFGTDLWEFESYESTAPSMLLGWGTGFKGSRRLFLPIHLVDVYQVMAYLLGMSPRPHNGSWAAVKRFLVPWEDQK